MKVFVVKGIMDEGAKEIEVTIGNDYVKIIDITTKRYKRLTDLEKQAKNPPVMAGTFYPTPLSDLAVISVLENNYFITRKSEGGKQIEIEMVDGILDTVPIYEGKDIVY